MSVGYGLGSLWALADTCTIVRLDPTSNTVSKRYTICNVQSTNAATTATTVAFGSLWFAFPDAHTLWRIQP